MLLKNSHFNKRIGELSSSHSLSCFPQSKKAKRIYLHLYHVFRLLEKLCDFSIGTPFLFELLILLDSLTFISRHFFISFYLIYSVQSLYFIFITWCPSCSMIIFFVSGEFVRSSSPREIPWCLKRFNFIRLVNSSAIMFIKLLSWAHISMKLKKNYFQTFAPALN